MTVSWPSSADFVFIILAVGAVTALAANYFEYRGIGSQEGILRRGPKPGRYVSITFDDGPSPEYTPRILDILKENDIKASFFLTGKMAERYPEIVKRMVDEGHDIGNHSYSHFNMILLDKDRIEDEVDRSEQAIRSASGAKPQLFRPPRGLYNEHIRRLLVERGYRIILWTVSAADWGPLGTKGIILRVLQFARNGAIILFHDGGSIVKSEGGNRERTVKALPVIIKRLRARGYEIVPVSDVVERVEELSCLGQAS